MRTPSIYPLGYHARAGRSSPKESSRTYTYSYPYGYMFLLPDDEVEHSQELELE